MLLLQKQPQAVCTVSREDTHPEGTGSRAGGRCNSPAAPPELQVIVHVELQAHTMLCLRSKHRTGPAVPSPESLITYCGVSFQANCSVNYDNKPVQARSRRTLRRRCWSTLRSQKCWRSHSSLGWLRTFCKNWFPTSQTCISPPWGPHPVLLPLQSPQPQTYPRSFPTQPRAAPGFPGASP